MITERYGGDEEHEERGELRDRQTAKNEGDVVMGKKFVWSNAAFYIRGSERFPTSLFLGAVWE